VTHNLMVDAEKEQRRLPSSGTAAAARTGGEDSIPERPVDKRENRRNYEHQGSTRSLKQQMSWREDLWRRLATTVMASRRGEIGAHGWF